MGGVWQALAFGVLGLSPDRDVLTVDPAPLPAAWRTLELRVVFHGTPLVVVLGHDQLSIRGSGPERVALAGDRRGPAPPPRRWRRLDDGSWEEQTDG